MDKKLTISIIIVVLIVLILIIVYRTSINNYEKYMYGLWVADSDFCSDADVENMLLFIGQPINGLFSVERPAYIIIQDDICSQSFTFTYRKGYGCSKYSINATCKFETDDIFDGDSPTFTFDMVQGTLRIHSGEKLYGRFYKQNDVSDVLAV